MALTLTCIGRCPLTPAPALADTYPGSLHSARRVSVKIESDPGDLGTWASASPFRPSSLLRARQRSAYQRHLVTGEEVAALGDQGGRPEDGDPLGGVVDDHGLEHLLPVNITPG